MYIFDKLELLFIIPIVGMILVLILPFNTEKEKERGKQIGLTTSILTLIESLRI
jgi:competence protein ComGC